MILEKLNAIEALRNSGEHERAKKNAVDLAAANPDDARAQLVAAYTSDRLGMDKEAIKYYERAMRIGLPASEREDFLISFASTLTNVGRVAEAISHLQAANNERPGNPAILAFLSLALHKSGKTELALATMLDAGLRAARDDGFAPYSRALGEYRDELLAAAQQLE